MLKSLNIQNYALIDSIELDFKSGLNVITGETGAGKSILIGALGLILGNRADKGVVNKATAKKCIIEASFNDISLPIKNFLEEQDFDIEEVLQIRREVTASGKTRAFINDTPTSLTSLKILASLLVDINGQNQSYIFKRPDIQLSILDDLAESGDLLADYQSEYQKYIKAKKALEVLIEKENKAQQNQDFVQFQFDELSQAQLNSGEEELIRTELEWMNNAETIKQALFNSTQTLSQGDDAIIANIENILNQLDPLQGFNPHYVELQKRLKSSLIEIQDIASEYEQLYEQTEFEPEKHTSLQERMDIILHLQQKHRKQTVDELLQYLDDLDSQLNDFGSLGNQIQELQQTVDNLYNKINSKAIKLSKKRNLYKLKNEQKIINGLQLLGMKDADFRIEIELLDHPSSSGIDKVDFLFSSNKGHSVDSVSKIASGGELARVVLTLKSLLSTSRNLPTVIFDEIDSGVSGDIASKVGDTMQKMSKNMQLITITHLPQIAAKGDWHFKVFKKEINNITQSDIRMLDNTERLHELALMISGDANSNSALKMAEELVG